MHHIFFDVEKVRKKREFFFFLELYVHLSSFNFKEKKENIIHFYYWIIIWRH